MEICRRFQQALLELEDCSKPVLPFWRAVLWAAPWN